jgi:hypothetical protein
MDKMINNFRVLIFFVIMLSWPLGVFAHQPIIVDTEKIYVTKPEVSKAYYAKLLGKPHTYIINVNSAIDLYVNVLFPYNEGPKKNITINVFKGDQSIGILSSGEVDWKKFFEPFGQSMYWQGPELKKNVDAGKYKILVQSKEKNLRYVLAIGETEAWNGIDSINAILLIPMLKKNFFEESPISFVLSPLGYGYILLLQFSVLMVGWIILKILKISGIRTQTNYIKKFAMTNIFLGLVFWVSLLFLAVTTTWHPLLIMISGFALFVTIISWRSLRYLNRINRNILLLFDRFGKFICLK